MTTHTSPIDPHLRQKLDETYQVMLGQDDLLSMDQLQNLESLFRSRFGPQRLKELDGENLLVTMHASGPDSMVYWLEYKNDEEFTTPVFGGIAGGSALKYGFYQRKESGSWMTGPPQNQSELSTNEAIEKARKHRDQLLVSTKLLEELPENGSDDEYRLLQAQLDNQAPDITNTAWCHKYLSLLFPHKIETYHVEDFQRFHLIKLLQTPPEEKGRYVTAGRYVALARELGIPLNHLIHLLNRYHGSPSKVWRIGTRIDPGDSIWPVMRDNDCVLIGWPKLGDLSELSHNQKSRDDLQGSLKSQYQHVSNLASRKAGEILNFAFGISEGDLVLPSDGQRIQAIGKIIGPYRHAPDLHSGAPHQRRVEWLHDEEWNMPVSEGLQTTVYQIRRNGRNLVEVEKKLLDSTGARTTSGKRDETHLSGIRLEGIPRKLQEILDRKGQAILYGPPGTGKTYWSQIAARDLASIGAYNRIFLDLNSEEQLAVTGDETRSGLVRACTFHPSYGYEDFLEGYRPHESDANQLVFRRTAGIFKTLCVDAFEQADREFYLLIDEINRGDIPRIFGELLTILENDKRGQSVFLPLSGDRFAVPKNVHIIGTMNTADRSIALLDTALRRRFGFIELMPDYGTLGNTVVGGTVVLAPWLSSLNERIRTSLGRDARNRQIGHAYLLDAGKPVTDLSLFRRILAEDILPLLEDYCYEDYAALARILGRGLIDEGEQRVRDELFDPSRIDELVQALLEPFPEISTSPEAASLMNAENLAEDELGEEEVE